MRRTAFQSGDLVVYRKTKHSTCPGPRAINVAPATRGETYTYQVDKFWVVQAAESDGTLRLRTRGGKEHVIDSDDPNLRRASLWERIRYRDKFDFAT